MLEANSVVPSVISVTVPIVVTEALLAFGDVMSEEEIKLVDGLKLCVSSGKEPTVVSILLLVD